METDTVEENHHMDISKAALADNAASSEWADIYDVFGQPDIIPRVGEDYQVELPSPMSKEEYMRRLKHEDDAEIAAGGPRSIGGLPIPTVWIDEKAGISSDNGEKGQRLVPGCSNAKWSDIEEAGFLLGLYIFGKDFVKVKRFLESKEMGDIMSYYYGRFYGSERCSRWIECRKSRNKRTVIGEKIFTGSTHQQLLARLLPPLSELLQRSLLEISKSFGDGKISLEEYASCLKNTVGLNSLIEAVAIGKGKQDLTGIAPEKPKYDQAVRPEIPSGKACSALTPPEIVNFLTGDFRLSKARSNDLFWEAVWPRLLARGWHSEQPNIKEGYFGGSKHPLVFLVPGIKKYSRRKLEKGNHYFDSVSDVLCKVASDPGLLEIEGYKSKEENGWENETKLEQEKLPDQERRCYLKPRAPNRGSDAMKFTVVDTTFVNGKNFKVRELRSLPFEIMNAAVSESSSEEDDEDSSEEAPDKSSSACTLSLDKDVTNHHNVARSNLGNKLSSDGKASKCNALKQPVKGAEACNGSKLKKQMKRQKSRKMESFGKNLVDPVVKRYQRSPPTRKDTSRRKTNRGGSGLQQEASSAENYDLCENVRSQVDPSQEKFSSSNSSKGSSPISGAEGICDSNHMGAEHPLEKPQHRSLIDLNLPVIPDAESELLSMVDMKGKAHEMSKEPDKPNAVKSSKNVVNSEQEPQVVSRRQSTRNRPLTAKVLEAFAWGYLDTKQKRKSRDAFSEENLKSKPSRGVRVKASTPESSNSVNVDCSTEETGSAIHNNNWDASDAGQTS
ncbi:hypothetical protein UlMin_009553 [Ulmus minor]